MAYPKDIKAIMDKIPKEHKKAQKIFHGVEQMKYKIRYQAMRLFCLDTQLISFNDIEIMENEINSSF